MRHWNCLIVCLSLLPAVAAAADAKVDYDKEVAPLLRKYCAGCHNDSDREGEFSLESFAALQQGIKEKPALLPGDSAGSRMWRLISGVDEPLMPPEGEAKPTEAERELVRLWIEQGAKGPAGVEPDRLTLRVPHIESRTKLSPVTALDFSPDGKLLAVASYGRVDLLAASAGAPQDWKLVRTLGELPGKVESVEFCLNGTQILTASGVAGSGGIATLWNVADGARLRDFKGHRDLVFDATLSPDGKTLATCSYDKEIMLWNAETGEQIRTLSGHNGAVYDIAFSPDGNVLASASADDTCKLWRVRDGERLDTLGQPQKEQYAIRFSPDGKAVLAAGADNRLRIWELKFGDQPGINPLTVARFAHEAPIATFCFSKDGSRLITAAEDRTIKIWETKNYTELKLLENQPDVVDAVIADPSGERAVIGRLNGSLELLPLPAVKPPAPTASPEPEVAAAVEMAAPPMTDAKETEPNDQPTQAQKIAVPIRIKGAIDSPAAAPDLDCYRFTAKAGETWVIEINAARSKSDLDSFIEILNAEGKPVERVLLQAVRDSYFTFRGKNSIQADDFRVFNWEEMDVNQFLYCNGEVVKLWRTPRGPDSGFDVFPGSGGRWNYFDTSGLTHAMGEPCYVVEQHPPGTELIPNGLPVFPLYYENDDAARREAGKDSKLFFTSPADGDYVLRIRDVRGGEGPQFAYTATIRTAAPDFTVSLANRKPQINLGNRCEVKFNAARIDQFDGQLTIDATNLPPGLTINTPLTIAPEQIEAFGVLSLAADAADPTPEQLKAIKLTATGKVAGRQVTHDIPAWEEIKVIRMPALELVIRPAAKGAQPLPNDGTSPLEFVIHPGETIMLEVVAERNGFKELIAFGTADCGRNLPHGVYVDNIGLNGLLLPADKSVREFFITASPWTPEQTRMFHLQSNDKNGPASAPVILHVKPAEKPVASTNAPTQ